jgi:hypothetical protein
VKPADLERRRARVKRLVAKRPDVAIKVTIERRDIDDPVRRSRLVRMLAALLDGKRTPVGR